MKVAIVTTGILDCLLPLVKYLSAHVSVDVYISVYGDKFAESVGSFDLSSLPEGMADEEISRKTIDPLLLNYLEEGEGTARVQLFKYPSLKVFNRRNFQLHRQFAAALNKKNYDVVNFNGYRGSQMFIHGFLKNATAKVWTVHDPVLHSGEDKWQTRLAYRLFRYLNAHFILHNHGQLSVFQEKNLIDRNRVHYIPFGPLEVFHLFENGSDIVQEPKTVLFWGRISPYKGVEYLVKAAMAAKKKIPGLRVVVAGKPNYAIDTSVLEGDPVFDFRNGFIENPELVNLIRQSAMVVCPYTDATQSGVLMTAYAFNKPVLATAVGGIPEVVTEGVTGCLVPPKNAEALENAMVQMLEEPGKLQEMSSNIKKMKSGGRFSWEKIARDTLWVYEQACK